MTEDTVQPVYEESSPGSKDREHQIAVHTDTFDISVDALGTDLPQNYYWNWRFIGIIFSCFMANNASTMPYYFPANAMPWITAELGTENSVWVSLSFTLSVATCMMVSGRLSDIFGRRWFIVGGNLLSTIGCIIASRAQNINTVTGGTVLCGLGAAIQINFPMIISELVPKNRRAIWIGLIYSSSVGTAGFSAVTAREISLNPSLGWRWIYYIGIMLSGLCTLGFFLCYHPPTFDMLHVRRSRWEQFMRQDFVGIFLFLAGLILFLMGLSWGGSLYPWDSAHTLATIIVGTILLAAFIIYEIYYKGDQLLPTYLFRAPGYTPMVVCATVGTCVIYSLAILWPSEVNTMFPGDETRRGFLTSVLLLVMLLGFGTAGVVIHYVHHHRTILATSCAVLTAMCGAMVSVQPGQTGKAAAFVGIGAYSIGFIEVATRALLPLSCPDEDLGAALGALGCIGYAVASIATAMYTTILKNKLQQILPAGISEAALNAGLPESSLPTLLELYATNITTVPGINPTIIASVQAASAQGYADSFRYVWYAALAFALCAFGSSLFTINYKDLATDSVARKLKSTKNEFHDPEAVSRTTVEPKPDISHLD